VHGTLHSHNPATADRKDEAITMEPFERFKAILRMPSPSQLAAMFAAADKRLLRDVSKRVHLGLSGHDVTEEQATVVLKACLALRNGEYLLKLVFGLTEPVAETAGKLLGDSFSEPTQDDLDGLTPKLVRQHGRLLTMLYYARVIAGDNPASSMLEQYFRPDGLFEVKADDSKPIPLPKPKSRAADPATKELRKQRKTQRKKQAAVVKPAVRKKRIKSEPKVEPKPTAKSSTKPESTSVIEQKRLEHPHVERRAGLSATDQSRGSVIHAYIAFDSANPEAGGKWRPCVVIAAGPKAFLVRACYSKSRKYAKLWRSVLLDDWKDAGLRVESYVGPNRDVVPRKNATIIGQLTVRDWNKVCRGEVNQEGDL